MAADCVQAGAQFILYVLRVRQQDHYQGTGQRTRCLSAILRTSDMISVRQADGHEEELAELFTYARDTVHNAEGLKRYGALNAALRILQVRRKAFSLSSKARTLT